MENTIRIVQIAIDTDYLYHAEKEALEAVTHGPDGAVNWMHTEHVFPGARVERVAGTRRDLNVCYDAVSEPMATTEPLYQHIMKALANVPENRYGIADVTSNYVFVSTNAPVAYDYGYCSPVAGPAEPKRSERRIVAMPKTRSEYQCARYGSGLYVSTVLVGATIKGLTEESIRDMLDVDEYGEPKKKKA